MLPQLLLCNSLLSRATLRQSVLSCVQEFMPPSFRKQHHGSADEMPKGTVEITCLPLASVLQMFGLTYIDFFSLDVEGRS